MIDLHCHILPGIDDGAKTSKDTLIMLKAAISEGVTVITATPHHDPKYCNERPFILSKVKEVEALIKENDLPIQILPGQEVRIFGELLEDFRAGKLVTSAGNTRYMLVEFPSNHVPRYAEQLFYEMKLEGLQPILVHPERNSGIIKNPDLLYKFINQGVLSQLTASSITGHFGKKIQKLSFQIIDHNLTHFIASDAHNVTSRAFKMQEAFEIINNRYGVGKASQFQKNARSVINDEAIFSVDVSKIKPKKFFNIF